MPQTQIAESQRNSTEPIRYRSFLSAGWRTTINSVLYLSGLRRKPLLLEGRLRRGIYRNWSGDRYHQATWAEPTTDAELADLIRSADTVRIVGSGHSFNDALASDGLTVSLDRLTGVVSIDAEARQVTARAGTRLRDLTAELAEHGLALRSLASHDAQSIGGILATDVHGTGRRPAHLSDQVVGMRLVDGTGHIHDLKPGDDLFRAAVGGLGAVGVITQVTVQCVEAFNLVQKTDVRSLDWAVHNLDRLTAANDHVSFYAYAFTDQVHVHTWHRTDAEPTPGGRFREALNEAKAAIGAALVGDGSAHLGVLPITAPVAMRLQTPLSLVHRSHDAFNRTQYHLHQELEVAVPRHRVWTDLHELIELYENMYRRRDPDSEVMGRRSRLPFLLVEVRFSPAGHHQSLLGAGVERDTAWLCLCCNQSGDVGRYFAEVERWARANGARPHLGKWCESFDASDIARFHGERYTRFQHIRAKADPHGRFVNPFVQRILGPVDDSGFRSATDSGPSAPSQNVKSSNGTA